MGRLRLARNLERIMSAKSLQGHFLVASPLLPDPNFARTVVLMIEHGSQGTWGLVLNRPGCHRVKRGKQGVDDDSDAPDFPLYVGGPVEGPLLALHDASELAESTACPGVFLSLSKEPLERLLLRTQIQCRLFRGYAGWAEGQLEDELKAGGWFVLPSTAELVFAPPDDIWPQLMREIGERLLAPILGPHVYPVDPSMN